MGLRSGSQRYRGAGGRETTRDTNAVCQRETRMCGVVFAVDRDYTSHVSPISSHYPFRRHPISLHFTVICAETFTFSDYPCDNPDQHLPAQRRWRRAMPKLPSGTVTFLFTDIEGSTALWER